ncbi:MAG TPA: hypothetical protein VK191_14990 [Symbiobacteriaceae bacterium]|nr:hypothetical protein [Symbiobacteriaceae bacterium]
MTKRRMAGGLILFGLILTGCAGAPVIMFSAPTAKQTAATKVTQPTNPDRFEERIEVAGGALKLTATPLKLGPTTLTVEAEGGLVPYEVQGIMAAMGHGWDLDLTASGTKWTVNATWGMEGPWAIRVKAKDSAGQEQVALFYVKVQP